MKKKRSLRNKFTGKKRWVIVGGVVVLLVAGVALQSQIRIQVKIPNIALLKCHNKLALR